MMSIDELKSGYSYRNATGKELMYIGQISDNCENEYLFIRFSQYPLGGVYFFAEDQVKRFRKCKTNASLCQFLLGMRLAGRLYDMTFERPS